MTSEVQVYQHPAFGSIRMFEEDGEIITVATDLAHALGYRDARDLIRSLGPDEFCTHTVRTKKGDREVYCVTEPGLYRAISMRKDSCIKDPATRETVVNFQRWVTHEVLPSIRKAGGYVNPQALPQIGDEEGRELMAQAVLYARQCLAKVEAENEAMRPMAEFGAAVSAATDCIEVRDLAHLLCQNGLKGMGLKNTFELLREDHYVFLNGNKVNVPYQKWVNQGLFEVQESTWTAPDGTVHVNLKTMVTQKGVAHFLRRYAPNRALPGLESESESEGES